MLPACLQAFMNNCPRAKHLCYTDSSAIHRNRQHFCKLLAHSSAQVKIKPGKSPRKEKNELAQNRRDAVPRTSNIVRTRGTSCFASHFFPRSCATAHLIFEYVQSSNKKMRQRERGAVSMTLIEWPPRQSRNRKNDCSLVRLCLTFFLASKCLLQNLLASIKRWGRLRSLLTNEQAK